VHPDVPPGTDPLVEYGWSEQIAERFANNDIQGTPGRIVRVGHRLCGAAAYRRDSSCRRVGTFGRAGSRRERRHRSAFPEIDELAQYGRFTDCSHETEPGCAVRAAVDCGDLDARRVESHRKLRRENEWIAARSDARLRHERTREIKVMSRAIRAYYRDR